MKATLRSCVLLAVAGICACKTAGGPGSAVLGDDPAAVGALSPGAVPTQHNDNLRTGANLQESVLTPANVGPGSFGKLFSRGTQGRMFAQPLYVPGVVIGGAPHNVVYVATMHNMVYAFDADDTASDAPPLWLADTARIGHSLNYKAFFTDPVTHDECRDLGPEVGITSTPAIDLATNTIYVVAKVDGSGTGDRTTVAFWLHALDLATGVDKQAPKKIEATAQGSWTDESGHTTAGPVPFDAFWLLNRPGLLLANGKVFVAFGSTCDHGTWRGWLLSYDASTFEQKGVFVSTPNGKAMNQDHGDFRQDRVPQVGGMGGIWQGGMGIPADDQAAYVMVGNGDVGLRDSTHTVDDSYGQNFGNSFVKLSLDDLSVTDWFTPYNAAWMNLRDFDLGSSGAMLLPAGTSDKPLLIGGGKQGILYLLDRSNLGKLRLNDVKATLLEPGDNHIRPQEDTQIPQKFEITTVRQPGPWFFNIHGSPVFWQGPQGPTIYIWAEQDPLKAYLFKNGKFGSASGEAGAPSGVGDERPIMHGMPGGMLSISANGAKDGIVWATHLADNASAHKLLLEGVLVAYKAEPDSGGRLVELWNSTQVPARDHVGSPGKFASPTIAGGKVFVASNGYDYDDKDYLSDDHSLLQVYGLLPTASTPGP